MVYNCDQCAAPLSPGALLCPKCGRKFDQAVPGNPVPHFAAAPQRRPLKPLAIGLWIVGGIFAVGIISGLVSPTPATPPTPVTVPAPATKTAALVAPKPKPAQPKLPPKQEQTPDTVSKAEATPMGPSMACKLATVDSGHYVDPEDPEVGKIQVQLDALKKVCTGGNDNNISETAFVSHQQLLKKGVEESSLSILEAVNQSIPDGLSQGKHLADIFAAYITLREQGMSRDETIRQLHGMLTTIAGRQ